MDKTTKQSNSINIHPYDKANFTKTLEEYVKVNCKNYTDFITLYDWYIEIAKEGSAVANYRLGKVFESCEKFSLAAIYYERAALGILIPLDHISCPPSEFKATSDLQSGTHLSRPHGVISNEVIALKGVIPLSETTSLGGVISNEVIALKGVIAAHNSPANTLGGVISNEPSEISDINYYHENQVIFHV